MSLAGTSPHRHTYVYRQYIDWHRIWHMMPGVAKYYDSSVCCSDDLNVFLVCFVSLWVGFYGAGNAFLVGGGTWGEAFVLEG